MVSLRFIAFSIKYLYLQHREAPKSSQSQRASDVHSFLCRVISVEIFGKLLR